MAAEGAFDVFAYGTLQHGQHNGYLLSPDWATFLHEAKTAQKYPLVIASHLNVPLLLDCAGQGHHVKGQVYRLKNVEALDRLDALECHPRVYTRREETVITADGNQLRCFIYFLPNFKPEFLALPHLERFDNSLNPDHLKYVPPSQRDNFLQRADYRTD